MSHKTNLALFLEQIANQLADSGHTYVDMNERSCAEACAKVLRAIQSAVVDLNSGNAGVHGTAAQPNLWQNLGEQPYETAQAQPGPCHGQVDVHKFFPAKLHGHG